MKVLSLIRKKLYSEFAKVYGKNKSYMYEMKEKEICVGFAASQAEKVGATVSDKCLAKMEKALNLQVEDTENVFRIMATPWARKHWAYTKASARDPLKQMTPSNE